MIKGMNLPELDEARILGIETSCDETAASIVENGRFILASTVASQVDLHAQFGGVFPEVASRQHIRTIYPIVETALQQAHLEKVPQQWKRQYWIRTVQLRKSLYCLAWHQTRETQTLLILPNKPGKK